MGQHPMIKERQVYFQEVTCDKKQNPIHCGLNAESMNLYSLWQSNLTEYCLLHDFKVLLLKVRKTLEIHVLK